MIGNRRRTLPGVLVCGPARAYHRPSAPTWASISVARFRTAARAYVDQSHAHEMRCVSRQVDRPGSRSCYQDRKITPPRSTPRVSSAPFRPARPTSWRSRRSIQPPQRHRDRRSKRSHQPRHRCPGPIRSWYLQRQMILQRSRTLAAMTLTWRSLRAAPFATVRPWLSPGSASD